MDTTTFNSYFDQTVGIMARRNGGSQRGRSVFIPARHLQVSVLRGPTGRQAMNAPPTYYLCIRHILMREKLSGELPMQPSTDMDNYYMSIPWGRVRGLLDPAAATSDRSAAFEIRTEPDEVIVKQLQDLAHDVEALLPKLPKEITAETMLAGLQRGSDSWILRLRIEDMEEAIARDWDALH